VDEDLFRKFTGETGIKVNLVKANTDQLINRLEMEGENSPADIIITADAGHMIRCLDKNLLQPMKMEKIASVVPSQYRDAMNHWTGITKRARVIVYSKERVNPANLNTYEDLVNPEWNQRVLIRSSQNPYNQTLMASIIAANGSDDAKTWAEGIVNNMAQPPTGNDRDQVKAIAAGIGDVAIVNTYYMGLLLNSSNQEEQRIAREMGIFFPNQADRGTHINISGIGITRHAPNKENAQKLIEFLLSEESQTALSNENYEYPVNSFVEWPSLLQEWGSFKPDTIPLYQLGKHYTPATIIFNEVGWK
jgi:iron(III) transport system substrate-binding protein